MRNIIHCNLSGCNVCYKIIILLKAITSKYYNTFNCYFIYCFFIMHYAFIIMPSNTLIMYCMGFTESVTKIIMPCNYMTCVWSSVSITWRANELFVEKIKDIVRHITDCKLCVVLRKRCTKAPKKMHYSQLVILFRFTKQNKQQLDITLTSSTHLPIKHPT